MTERSETSPRASLPRLDSAPAIDIQGLLVELGGQRILGPLDLTIEQGSHVLVVGSSGCGKTTLLRAIAGFLTPSKGSVSLAGQVVSEKNRLCVAPEQRGVGMLFQGGALWPHMSVEKTLRFTLKHGGQPVTRARIDELLRAVHLEHKSKSKPAQLSGGEKQRLSLARALAIKPKLLLLDEPLGPLDATLREELLGTLARLQEQEGWTMLHVTHDPDEASRFASRVLNLEAGRIISDVRLTHSAPSPTTEEGSAQ